MSRFAGQVIREAEWLDPSIGRTPRIDPEKERAAQPVEEALDGALSPVIGTVKALEGGQ